MPKNTLLQFIYILLQAKYRMILALPASLPHCFTNQFKVMYSFKFALLFLFSSFLACQQVQENAIPLAEGLAVAVKQETGKAPTAATNIVLQSADGGQTWQDISAGLPLDFKPWGLLVGDSEVYLRAEHEMYRSSPASTSPVWEKEALDEDPGVAIFPGRAGVFTSATGGRLFQKVKGAGVWLPVGTQLKGHSIYTIFESPEGNLVIGCDNGIYKSTDHAKTWKQVFYGGWVMRMVESEGVLLCTNEGGILRSTDGGEHWEVVLSEGGVGIAVEVIKGGFAAITFNTESESRRMRTSTDGGKTWQAIDAGLSASMDISSIKQMGEYFFCGHPDGIYRSGDRGKTWELILPSIRKKVFNLSVSGGVIYAVPRDAGC